LEGLLEVVAVDGRASQLCAAVEDDGDDVVVALEERGILVAVDVDDLVTGAEDIEVTLGDLAEMAVFAAEETQGWMRFSRHAFILSGGWL
jgi:hypothetical protein